MTEGTPHTAGPWEVSSGDIWAVSPWNARVKIASVTRFASMNGINADANARLIAAAPDLLELARQIIGADEDDTWSSDRGWLVERARAAIAKAEGSAV